MANERLRNGIVMPLGQGMHWISVRMQRVLNESSRKDVRRLPDSEAIETGSELLSEAFIFFVAAVAITNEYMSSAAKSAAKAQQLDRTLEELGASVDTLEQEIKLLVMEQQRQVERLNQELLHLTTLLAKGQKPRAPLPAPTQGTPARLPDEDGKACIIS